MTPTEIGRRSDALHYSQVSRRELCDMIARREDRIDSLTELVKHMYGWIGNEHEGHPIPLSAIHDMWGQMRELGVSTDA